MNNKLIEKLRAPKKWVYLIEGNNYRTSSAPQEAADYIEYLERKLRGEWTDESDLQSDGMEQSGIDLPFQQAG